jgi:hypothetical protein
MLPLFISISVKNKDMGLKLDGSEASMIPLIANHVDDIISGNPSSYFSFPEFSVGRGIADIYIVSKNAESFDQRRRAEVPAITDKQQNEIVNILWQNNGMLFGELNQMLHSRKLRNVGPNVQALLDSKVINVDGGRVFIQESTTTNIIEYSIAIEAKVSDWKKGLMQAMRYKNFADKSYLALYESHLRVARNNLDVFKTLNIGLIGVSDEGIQIHFKPEANTKDPFKAYLASERVYSLIDDAQDGFVARNNLTTYSSAA